MHQILEVQTDLVTICPVKEWVNRGTYFHPLSPWPKRPSSPLPLKGVRRNKRWHNTCCERYLMHSSLIFNQNPKYLIRTKCKPHPPRSARRYVRSRTRFPSPPPPLTHPRKWVRPDRSYHRCPTVRPPPFPRNTPSVRRND